ncbi:prepilin-type N-terminal cleavage/methylation domain-containing protein [Vagococcus lutrae]|uniref:competence type IV pilus major pilin ComGC n=1 Tax=Vagococcus TaxID=2737 RepID=UPI000EBE4B68|nr:MULTISPECIES: competence type IV pilus major pilin ComGC [Vagococcus]MDT2801901.1 competence type IV pilus major pilin ComGC [Vagococcus lutrae]MDT2806510.1 competence type IV pilus major pilin ComGC [Vagococcus lutrae]MDT2817666.1 competence type IV pilus major pilin ComGC [Vagococcus lutrae]MDT2826129.1 competence type IV pilus major pilin ComGC [Vagococcus lutrae]MDT2841854.1 competence type IV pilus major pilin ComGC [Vagococcus lutrae]
MLAKKRKKYQGFTLLEMLVVILIISFLVMLVTPKLVEHGKKAEQKSDAAFEQVVKTQIELYQFNETDEISVDNLINKGYLDNKQIKKAQELNLLQGIK